ncbi:transcriptional regulator, DeoR family [Bacteroidales bacterium KA00344]|nr:transcriptional regulator, DeoR family [Bacteroidales bacterium KA00344]
MTKEERREAILEQFIKQDVLQVSDLAEQLNVSPVTIRKDLTTLEKEGKLYRSHGRAIAINPFAINRSVNEKELLNMEEKHRIGMEAAKLIDYNDSIIIASGTTIHAFSKCIKPKHRLMVVSAALPASINLSQIDGIDVVQLGGNLRQSSLSVVGQYSERLLCDTSFSKLFLGVDGIDFDYGISTTDLSEALLNRQMIEAAQRTIVLADSSKFGRRGFAKICDMETIDTIITDSNLRAADRDRIEELGIELIIAEIGL